MSSTGRGRERVPNDYYPTPPWVVWRLLDAHESDLKLDNPRAFPGVLEPNVGDGAIIRALGQATAPIHVTGVELRRDALYPDTQVDDHFEGVDFRTWIPQRRYDLAIGNPPFSLAEEILRRVFTMASITAMLLRLNFLGSEDRIPFWKSFPRPAVRVIPERISFDGEGSDSDYCAWFIWGTELRDVDVLGATPLAIRNAHKPRTTPVVPQLGMGF